MNIFPILSPPVTRPHLVQPWSTVNVTEGTIGDLVSVYMHLTHGANYDDPSPWHGADFLSRKVGR
jgi:cyanobactin biosynthesis protein (PatB/AcyB/McaB family)